MELAVRLILGAILAGAALSKLAAPRAGAAAMATYGFRSPASRWSTFSIVVAAELILAVGVVAGSDTAAYAAAALMALFATTLASALMQGRAGEPCGCFGSESKVSGLAVARNGALAVALAAIPTLPASLSASDSTPATSWASPSSAPRVATYAERSSPPSTPCGVSRRSPSRSSPRARTPTDGRRSASPVLPTRSPSSATAPSAQ